MACVSLSLCVLAHASRLSFIRIIAFSPRLSHPFFGFYAHTYTHPRAARCQARALSLISGDACLLSFHSVCSSLSHSPTDVVFSLSNLRTPLSPFSLHISHIYPLIRHPLSLSPNTHTPTPSSHKIQAFCLSFCQTQVAYYVSFAYGYPLYQWCCSLDPCCSRPFVFISASPKLSQT